MSRSGGVVAILFTDFAGCTEVPDRLGDDAAEELRRTRLPLLREAVEETGRPEIKNLGDGFRPAGHRKLNGLSEPAAQ